MAFPLTQCFIDQYRRAAAEGATVELKLRLLADKIPDLQKYAHQQMLKDVELAIVVYFGLSDKDKTALERCLQLRNKILHCEFDVARQKLDELGLHSPGGGVRKVDLSGLTAEGMRSKVKAAITDVPGTSQSVANIAAKQPGGVFGWLLEMGCAGDFLRAADAFKAASAIVERLTTGDRGKAGT